MPKQLLFESEARAALLRGVNIMAEAVKATLGPKGRNVVIDKKFGSPTITKDGVTVAKEVELKDPYEDMGAQMIKEVASKTSDVAGDGTTTATVLAQADLPRGPEERDRRREPDGAQARHRAGGREGRRGAQEDVQDDQGQEGDRAGREHRRQQRQDHRQPHRRGDGEGRQGRRHHGRGSQGDGDDPRGRRGHAVRPRLSLAVLRDRPGADGDRARRRARSSSTRRRSA